jgi:hypothetical protein
MFNWFKKKAEDIDPLESLVDNLIKEVELDDLPEADRNFLKGNLMLQISRRLGGIIMENLDEKGLAAYVEKFGEAILPEGEKLQEFLEEYLPDYEEKIKTGLEEFLFEAARSLKGE